MKTAVISGTSRGIGHALAEKFLQEGFKVIGTSTSGKTDITDKEFEVVQLDLTDPESIEEAAKAILNKTSQIDVLINNSGVSLDDWDIETLEIPTLRKPWRST